MEAWLRRFNLYLALAALTLLCGCQTDRQKEPAGVLRVYIEAGASNIGTAQTISVVRSTPVLITVSREPILTEANIAAAKVIDVPGGFALEIQFNQYGTRLLEQYSAANPGKHFAIFAQWGKKPVIGRWLAAPIITHRISDGILSFNADIYSREETEQLALSLNAVAKKLQGASK